jgi:hypothetical protein
MSSAIIYLDFQRFRFADSWHTRGFYQRAGALYHHTRGTPSKKLFWVPVSGGAVAELAEDELELNRFLGSCLACVPAIAVHAQFEARTLATAARPLASTDTVSSELHRSRSQKYGALSVKRVTCKQQKKKCCCYCLRSSRFRRPVRSRLDPEK